MQCQKWNGTASDNVENVMWTVEFVDGGNSLDGINYNNLKNADNVTFIPFNQNCMQDGPSLLPMVL
ncbi:MAG: hypothetical protein CM15mP66_10420 [Pseudomonadota bacterium]|nr:MAG: hypothetical protein CM15mP66_10420 [Pseudomonadota bacterium]